MKKNIRYYAVVVYVYNLALAHKAIKDMLVKLKKWNINRWLNFH